MFTYISFILPGTLNDKSDTFIPTTVDNMESFDEINHSQTV
ncbi:MAG: hypothetical protein Q8S84_00595 [bacterium]|nr:hypothetical protein [bacterium]MDP3380086.1 hypothetical protein [bacterium]